MKKVQSFVGIDVSKATLDVFIHGLNLYFVVENSLQGFVCLLEKVMTGTKCKKEELFFDNKRIEVSSYRRDDFFAGFKFSNPALILESTSTLFIPPGFRCEVDDWGSILAKI